MPRAMSCLFCSIAAGKIPAERVLENAHAFAFLDIQPLARGHTLVVPKRHAVRVEELAAEDVAALFDLAKRCARRLGEGLGAAGVTWGINDGRAAGQEVQHVHVHLVPRHEGDGGAPIHKLFEPVDLAEGELPEIGARLRG